MLFRSVGYDKNVPNLDGLSKLLRLLSGVPSGVSLKLLLVVPSSLQHDMAWARVRTRSAAHVGLTVHNVQGGEREAYRIFRQVCIEQ